MSTYAAANAYVFSNTTSSLPLTPDSDIFATAIINNKFMNDDRISLKYYYQEYNIAKIKYCATITLPQ